jgi:hypothetical protein
MLQTQSVTGTVKTLNENGPRLGGNAQSQFWFEARPEIKSPMWIRSPRGAVLHDKAGLQYPRLTNGKRRGAGQRWSALGRGQRWVRQAIAISFTLRVTDAASARTCRPIPIALSVAAPKLTPSRAWCRTCRGSAYQTMTIRGGKTIATKASG